MRNIFFHVKVPTASVFPLCWQRETNVGISRWSKRRKKKKKKQPQYAIQQSSYFHVRSKRDSKRTSMPIDSWPMYFWKPHHKRCLSVFFPLRQGTLCFTCSIITCCYGYKRNTPPPPPPPPRQEYIQFVCSLCEIWGHKTWELFIEPVPALPREKMGLAGSRAQHPYNLRKTIQDHRQGYSQSVRLVCISRGRSALFFFFFTSF